MATCGKKLSWGIQHQLVHKWGYLDYLLIWSIHTSKYANIIHKNITSINSWHIKYWSNATIIGGGQNTLWIFHLKWFPYVFMWMYRIVVWEGLLASNTLFTSSTLLKSMGCSWTTLFTQSMKGGVLGLIHVHPSTSYKHGNINY